MYVSDTLLSQLRAAVHASRAAAEDPLLHAALEVLDHAENFASTPCTCASIMANDRTRHFNPVERLARRLASLSDDDRATYFSALATHYCLDCGKPDNVPCDCESAR